MNLENADQFCQWSTEATCGIFDRTTERWFENTINSLVTVVNDSPFLSGLPEYLRAAAEAFEEKHRAKLFGVERDASTIRWHRKEYAAFVDKLFRLNVVENERYPEAPPGGWIRPTGALRFGAVDDLVRTTVVVAYADGPPFLSSHIEERARQATCECVVKDHTKDKGYYGYHVYVGIPMDVAQTAGGFVGTRVPVEIQITTELQAALREVTHRLYEAERVVGGPIDGWKHDFRAGRFRAAYMAHSLRFIEAMIVDLREATLGAEKQ